MAVTENDVSKAEHLLEEAKANLQTAQYELETKQNLQGIDPSALPAREVGRLQVVVQGRMAAVNSATAARDAVEEKFATQLQAEKASADAALDQAKVELSKTVIRAGVSGRVEQFTLRVGDVVNPLMRPAGILIPDNAGRYLTAGFDQIEAQVMKVGMIAEVKCVSTLHDHSDGVTDLQGYIAAGQFRGGEQLPEPKQVTQPGTLIAFLQPLYKGRLECRAGQQLHCQRLFEQPRRARARLTVANSDAAASVQDPGVRRALRRRQAAQYEGGVRHLMPDRRQFLSLSLASHRDGRCGW